MRAGEERTRQLRLGDYDFDWAARPHERADL
jgi:hypothetical protein